MLAVNLQECEEVIGFNCFVVQLDGLVVVLYVLSVTRKISELQIDMRTAHYSNECNTLLRKRSPNGMLGLSWNC